MLTEEWGEFLKANEFLAGISIDGPPAMHDAYRVDKGGKPTFDRVMKGLEVLKRHQVDWNVLTTVHAVNGDHGREVYRFLRDELAARFVPAGLALAVLGVATAVPGGTCIGVAGFFATWLGLHLLVRAEDRWLRSSRLRRSWRRTLDERGP